MTTTSCRICAAVTADRMDDLCRRRDAAARDGDLVELRLDGVRDVDVAGALANRSSQVVVTCRPVWEGGRFDGSEEERERVLTGALDAGADWIDVEWNAPGRDRLLALAGSRAVLSLHDFDGVPADLETRLAAMVRATEGIVKIAVLARRLPDLLPLLDLGRRFGAPARLVLIAMGDAGLVSRILAARFGSCWSFAGEGVAPGQIPVRRLVDEFRFRDITASTPVYGLLGCPTVHSVSPAMHNAAFAASNIPGVYVPFEAEAFADFAAVAEPLGVLGASVTAPLKRDAFSAASRMPDRARRIGAVNTLRRRDAGVWDGDNTDAAAFLAPLAGLELEGRRATILGAGGAARAVAAALSERGARVTVCARRLDAASDVAGPLGAVATAFPPPPASWDLLVNATPVGTWPRAADSPMRGEALDGEMVYDLVYNPDPSTLLTDARASGCRTQGGLDMLVAQAAAQWSWWTGKAAPIDAMREAARRALAAMREEPGRS